MHTTIKLPLLTFCYYPFSVPLSAKNEILRVSLPLACMQSKRKHLLLLKVEDAGTLHL